MTNDEAAKILQAHNDWRRDRNVPNAHQMQDVKLISQAIDHAVMVLRDKTPDPIFTCDDTP